MAPVLFDERLVLRNFSYACDRDPVRGALVVEANICLRVVLDLFELVRDVVREEIQGQLVLFESLKFQSVSTDICQKRVHGDTNLELPNNLWKVDSVNELFFARASRRRLVETTERSCGVSVLFGPVAEASRSSIRSSAGFDWSGWKYASWPKIKRVCVSP